eukprot:6188038-Pleurochrysis_carterae.AAC.2
MEGKELTDNARAHYKFGKRTHVNVEDKQFRRKYALLLEGAHPVAVVQSLIVAMRTWLLYGLELSSSSLRCRLETWHQTPPFAANNQTAVEFLKAVLDVLVGTGIKTIQHPSRECELARVRAHRQPCLLFTPRLLNSTLFLESATSERQHYSQALGCCTHEEGESG